MIKFSKFHLDNGLTVLIHEDHQTPLAVVNTMYKVGSRNEDAQQTGFAHLFEHLMFGGSANAPEFDVELQKVGGENNAFTNTDITNYYITLPSANLETALWLESDRMMHLTFDQRRLDIQKNVVVEEFKQRYLNQPYGDVWLHLRPLAYTVHPYRWATIGKDISHIEQATLGDVVEFFNKYYHPANAILVIAGNVKTKETIGLVERWFGSIPGSNVQDIEIPAEPPQKKSRSLGISARVPQHAIYKAYHMPGRKSNAYYAADMTSDILGRGKSSELYLSLVRGKKVFNSINAYVSGSIDPGLLIVSGKVNEPYGIDEAHGLMADLISDFTAHGITDKNIQKVINQSESSILFSRTEILNRAIGLAVAEMLGNANLVNEELDVIRNISAAEVESAARSILKEDNCSTLFYHAESYHPTT